MQVMSAFLEEYQNKLGIRITCSQEREPLGTAGPLALARETLMEEPNQPPFFVLNSDIACEYPLQDLIDFHNTHEGEASIMVTQVSCFSLTYFFIINICSFCYLIVIQIYVKFFVSCLILENYITSWSFDDVFYYNAG